MGNCEALVNKKLHGIAQHYESTVKMAFFICFHSILAVLAVSGKNHNIIHPILKYSTKYLIFCHVHGFYFY